MKTIITILGVITMFFFLFVSIFLFYAMISDIIEDMKFKKTCKKLENDLKKEKSVNTKKQSIEKCTIKECFMYSNKNNSCTCFRDLAKCAIWKERQNKENRLCTEKKN